MYKPEPITESGAFARSLAKMAKHYHANIQTWKLALTFEVDRFVYRLSGRDSGLDTFEEVGWTPEQVMQQVNQTLSARYAGKMSAQTAKDAASNNVTEGTRTTAQVEEIIRLLNHPLIERREKTNVLLNIRRMSETHASELTIKLRAKIEGRENPAPAHPNKHIEGIATFLKYHG